MTFPKNSPFTPTEESIEQGKKALDNFSRPPVHNTIPVQRIRDIVQTAMGLMEDEPDEARGLLIEALDLLKRI